MRTHILTKTLKTFACIIFMSAMVSCNYNNKTESNERSSLVSGKVVIPDSVAQFLITSAATDFRNHQPPTAIDFRNIKIGYISSQNSEKIFVLCGEFLSKEHNEWVGFTTIKTSGYEQYLGKTQYCQEATMVLTDENLSLRLKNKFAE